MIDLNSAQNALKDAYLSAASNILNTQTNPLFSKIKQSSSDVYGRQIIKVAPIGINGGVGAGSETGELPIANGNNYAQLKTTLKNLYGTLEISDKAVRASANNNGAFVDLLSAEMEGLLNSSKVSSIYLSKILWTLPTYFFEIPIFPLETLILGRIDSILAPRSDSAEHLPPLCK